MPTRDDYRVLQSGVYYEILDLENAKTEEELRRGIKRLKGRLASSMTEKELAWAESQFEKANL